MAVVSLDQWNQFLQNHPHAHLLQTGEWGELKSAFGWKAVRFIRGSLGAQVLFRKLPLGFTVGYLPKPVNGDQIFAGQAAFWAELDAVCRRHRAIFLKIEPDIWEPADSAGWLSDPGLRISPHNIQPPRTITVDISCAEDLILARMKPKTRYNIRLAAKKGVTVRAWDDLSAFHQMLLLTGKRDGFGVHSQEYYRRAYDLMYPQKMCEVLLAEYNGKALAALMVACHGNRAYYLYGASAGEERSRMPTYLMQWEAMRWAKSLGCESYDLWGVPDQDTPVLEAGFEKRRDGLWGVYRFKRGFGGSLKRATQAVDRVYKPILYEVYLRRMAPRENS